MAAVVNTASRSAQRRPCASSTVWIVIGESLLPAAIGAGIFLLP